jgi:predicted DNA-binding protein
MTQKREITIRVTEQEFSMLENHCQAVGRTKTDILREYIRTLENSATNKVRRAPC